MDREIFNIADYIREDLVIIELNAEDRNGAISELIDKIYRVDPSTAGSVTKEDVLSSVMEREDSQTTGIGEGLAFPHTRIKGWGRCVVVIATSSKGIDFNSLDKKPAHLISLVISSNDEPYLVLQIMAAMIRNIKDDKVASILRDDITAKEICGRFESQHSTKFILARDVMRPVKIFVKMNDNVESAIRLMHINQLDALPVVDEDLVYKGFISCFDIFNYSIPDFFHQLQTVSFVRHLDPFEKYFIMKHGLAVKDLLSKEDHVISEKTSLMEIIFQLSIKNKVKLFVLEDNKLVGEIDRFSLIDKILFC